MLRDRARRVFARPQKVHRIRHDGRYFQIESIHLLAEPSPQRTPLIYQAGASSSVSAASTLNVTDAAAAGVRGPEGSGESEPRGQRSTADVRSMRR